VINSGQTETDGNNSGEGDEDKQSMA